MFEEPPVPEEVKLERELGRCPLKLGVEEGQER